MERARVSECVSVCECVFEREKQRVFVREKLTEAFFASLISFFIYSLES